MAKLTIAKIKRLDKPGLYGDGGTLYLSVAAGGSKSWIQRVKYNGRRRDIGLGGWPVVSLAKARERAFLNRVAIADGRDPLADKRKATVPTFREAADAVFEATRPTLKSDKAARLWIAQLKRYALPVLGDMPVDKIGREDVLRVLSPIWTEKAETARKLRQRIKATLAWAQARGHVEHNAAGEAINGALPKQAAVKEHRRALPHGEVAAALDTIDGAEAFLSVKLAFRFLVLTAARSGEVRGATWQEIDMDAREWRIPGARMKAGREHRVPLSDAAMAVLDQARPLADDSGLVFPATKRGKALADMAMMNLLGAVGLADRATVHGFRSSFRDWCAETNRDRQLAEAALAHTVGGVEGAYFRSDLMDRRRDLMAAWADYATGTAGKVVALRA